MYLKYKICVICHVKSRQACRLVPRSSVDSCNKTGVRTADHFGIMLPGLGPAGRRGGAATRKRGGSKMDLAGIEFTGIFHFFLLQCVPAPLPQVFEKYISDIHIF